MTEYGIKELKHRVKENKVLTFEERKYINQALTDIQAYRAIGTVEECRTAVERMKNIQSVIDSVRETCYQMGLDESQAEILTNGIKEKLDLNE